MRNEDGLLALANELHAGACDDRAWGRALDRISDSFAGASVVIGQEGATALERRFRGHRLHPDALERIGGPLANPSDNPFLAAMPRMSPGRSSLTQDVCGDEALVDSALYRDALQPFGARFVLGGIMEEVAGRASIVALVRPEAPGDFEECERHLLDRIMPCLSSALHLREQFDACRAAARLSVDLIADFGQGMILADDRQRILLINREAERLFDSDDGLDWRYGLVAWDRCALGRLRQAVRGGARATIAFERPSGRRAYVVTVIPAPPETGARTVLLIADPDRGPTTDRRMMCDLYGLTGREAAVASMLAEGADLGDAAGRLGISLNTAKTHLKAIFLKVGVNRQASLVRRLVLDLRGS